MSDPEGNGGTFRVYKTCNISNENIHTLLSAETEGAVSEDDYEIQNLDGTAQTACQHHRSTVTAGGEYHLSLFVIVDRADAREEGVLNVNLKPYHGYPDAVRTPPGDAIEAISSLSIMNTDWYEERDSGPVHQFALYNLLSDEAQFEKAKNGMNFGVQQLNLPEDSDDEDFEPLETPPHEAHRAVQPEGKDFSEVSAEHPTYARENELSEEYFAVIDVEYDNQGPLFVRLRGDKQDSFRCKGPAAGELLGWIYIGFMTWGEAKAFAARQ